MQIKGAAVRTGTLNGGPPLCAIKPSSSIRRNILCRALDPGRAMAINAIDDPALLITTWVYSGRDASFDAQSCLSILSVHCTAWQ